MVTLGATRPRPSAPLGREDSLMSAALNAAVRADQQLADARTRVARLKSDLAWAEDELKRAALHAEKATAWAVALRQRVGDHASV